MRLQDALRDYTVSDVLDSWKIIPTEKRKPMINESRLKAGQIIRYGPALYRVDYVNECRARIVPLSKKVDGMMESGGISIGPTSSVEIITDLERAKAELELEATEKELRAAKAEMASRDKAQEKLVRELAEVEAEVAEAKAVLGSAPTPAARPATLAPRETSGSGWAVVPGAETGFKPGTLAARVLAYIEANPGLQTREIVAGIGAEGAIAACVSRFNQAGIIHKS